MHYTQKKLIRDRLVCGVHSDTLRKSLLRDPKLTLAKAMSVCQIYEQTEQHTRDPATPQTTTTIVYAIHQASAGKYRNCRSKYKPDAKHHQQWKTVTTAVVTTQLKEISVLHMVNNAMAAKRGTILRNAAGPHKPTNHSDATPKPSTMLNHTRQTVMKVNRSSLVE